MNQFDAAQLWKTIWDQKLLHIILFSAFLLSLVGVLSFRNMLVKKRRLFGIVRYTMLAISFLYVGLFLKAQPTTANLVILTTALHNGQFPLGLFMLEPYIFLSFLFIGITAFVWGRGAFCGWLCPYGAMLELFHKGYSKLFPKGSIQVPDKINRRLVWVKYGIFAVIIGVTFYNFLIAEFMTEVEPFRTLVLKLNREWYFVLYFGILTVASLVFYRAFCRYLCPLGAAVALPSFIKYLPFLKLRRYGFCSHCKICAKDCNPSAIHSDGTINYTECLTCLDCQLNYVGESCPGKKKEEGRGIDNS